MTTARQELARIISQFATAFNAGDMAAVAALYAEDAILMPPDSATLTGRGRIAEYWQAARETGMRDVALRTLKIEGEGSTFVDIGTAEAMSDAGSQSLKYIAVWKQVDGRWQMAADIWNANP
jgi:uncharacterized protein (TIGR02246 family)